MLRLFGPALCRRVSFFAIGVIAFPAVTADVAAEEESAYELEEIIVTGSRIKRKDFTSPSPLTTIDRNTIEFSGQPTLEETLNQMPQVAPDFGRATTGSDGTSRINLRGMGAGRTLVLLNSRRIAPSGVGSAVDVNNLPQALIERVEIITGGATTVYGSDAVAGVVNFITRDDFDGLAIEGSAYTTQESDSDIYDLNVAYGGDFAGNRGRFTIYGGVYEREELLMSEREISEVVLENNDQTGELERGDSAVTPSGVIFFPPADFGNGPARTTFDSNGIPREFIDPDDLFNIAPFVYLQTPLSRKSGGIFASYELDNGYDIYFESGFSNNQATQALAPVNAASFGAQINTDNPVLTPEARQHFIDNYEVAPGLAVIAVGRRLVELGSRTTKTDRDYWRTVLGIRGAISSGWDLDAWLTYTRSDETEFYLNDASRSRFLQGLLVDPVTGQCFDPGNGCVPLDIFGAGRLSQAAQDFLRISNVQNTTERTQILASMYVTGSPLDTWAGSLDMAVGLEWRSDDASFKADDVLFTGETLGFLGDATVEGKETVTEIYGEAIIPLASDVAWAERLALELGARYSDYDNAGGVTTYKLGGDWQVSNSLRIRGMHQRSVRAPNNQELFQENFTEISFFSNSDGDNDPCSASEDPIGAGNADKCILQGLPPDQVGVFQAFQVPTNFIGGGNQDLVPEEAETTTFGIVITPDAFPSWSFSVDYYDLQVDDSIGEINARDICFDPSNVNNLYCDAITRDPDPNTAAGNVVEVFQPIDNRGTISTKGVDTLINYRAALPNSLAKLSGGAQLGLDFVWTHTLEYRWQTTPVSEVADCAGHFGTFCAQGIGGWDARTVPENRATTNINYGNGPLSLHLTWRWIDGSTNSLKREAEFFGLPEPLVAIDSIGSLSYFDLGLGYEFTDGIRARFGISNLFDENPPLMADGGDSANTDTGLYDVFGRSFYLSLSMNFFQ